MSSSWVAWVPITSISLGMPGVASLATCVPWLLPAVNRDISFDAWPAPTVLSICAFVGLPGLGLSCAWSAWPLWDFLFLLGASCHLSLSWACVGVPNNPEPLVRAVTSLSLAVILVGHAWSQAACLLPRFEIRVLHKYPRILLDIPPELDESHQGHCLFI